MTSKRPPSNDAGKRAYYSLEASNTDRARIKKEREKAQELKKTSWWNQLLQRGTCHYCEKNFKPTQLTMDHVVPLARGGTSTKGNLVPACQACNQKKRLDTPVDQLLEKIAAENAARSSTSTDESDE